MPSAFKGKGKGRDPRQSRSRNTTPSTAGGTAPLPTYLESDVTKLIDAADGQYAEMLELVAAPNIPDSNTLETLTKHLRSLSDMADSRGETCNVGMREMVHKRKDVVEDQELSREVGDRAKLKRETEEDEDPVHKKVKKRKERASKEERPLNHGAHDVARQDGAETKIEGGKRELKSHGALILIETTPLLPTTTPPRRSVASFFSPRIPPFSTD